MYGGRIIEQGPTDRVFANPVHPYTRGLIGAVPRISLQRDRLAVIPGQPPSAGQFGEGCRFAPRCAEATQHCFAQYPPERHFQVSPASDNSRAVSCWNAAGLAS